MQPPNGSSSASLISNAPLDNETTTSTTIYSPAYAHPDQPLTRPLTTSNIVLVLGSTFVFLDVTDLYGAIR